MDSEIINDLKQFITAAITQQTYDLRQDIERVYKKLVQIDNKIEKLDKKLMYVGKRYTSGI